MREKPVEVNKEYDVAIDEVGVKGDGIARVEGFVIFVPDTRKGDNVKIRVTQVMDKFAIAEKVGEAAAAPAEEAPAEEAPAEEAPAEEAPAEETPEEAPAEEAPEEAPAEEAPAEEAPAEKKSKKGKKK